MKEYVFHRYYLRMYLEILISHNNTRLIFIVWGGNGGGGYESRNLESFERLRGIYLQKTSINFEKSESIYLEALVIPAAGVYLYS